VTVKRALLLAVATALLVAGCSGGGNESASSESTTAPAETKAVQVYFLCDGKVWPVSREVEGSSVASAALGELGRGPTDEETSDLGMSSALPTGGAQLDSISILDGIARYGSSAKLSTEGLAQVVYTLTQFPEVRKVEVDGMSYTRAAFEELTPAILVESPLPFEKVTSPLRVTGTANTFEATFQYELFGPDATIVAKNFVTATSGTGTRGTFDFTFPFEIAEDGLGKLVVFELSAENGSRINEVEIPLRMEK